MDEAAKLSEVGKFDRSNAAADKVYQTSIKERRAICLVYFFLV